MKTFQPKNIRLENFQLDLEKSIRFEGSFTLLGEEFQLGLKQKNSSLFKVGLGQEPSSPATVAWAPMA